MADIAIDTFPKVVIIILNWNNWRDSVACLDSLSRISYTNYEIVLLDNASEDGSVKHLKDYCECKTTRGTSFAGCWEGSPAIKITTYKAKRNENGKRKMKEATSLPETWLTLIENDRNDGFCGGNNLAIAYALEKLHPQYLLLLNNDTIVDQRFLEELVIAAESDETIGFAGPTTYYYTGKQTDAIQCAGGVFDLTRGINKPLTTLKQGVGQRDQIRKVDYVSGVCLLTRKRVIEDIGVLDTRYFAYWEESDWCFRGHKAGYKSVHVPKSKIWHKMDTSKPNAAYFYYNTRNKFWFIKKNGTKVQYFTTLLFFFAYDFWFTVAMLVLHHKKGKNEFTSFVKGIIDGITRSSVA